MSRVMRPQGANTALAASTETSHLSPRVADQVAIGTKAILDSPHVSEGPGRIANAPVPSVFNDDRGSIDRLRVGGNRINLLHSKASVMRSGYLHPEVTHDFVVSGSVEVWVLEAKGTKKTVYNANDAFQIPKYTPHLLHFLEDSVIAEWWNQSNESRCWYYHPYRNIVDVQNSLVSTSTGRHSLLIPQHDFDKWAQDLKAVESMKFQSTVWMIMGVAVGFILGVSLTKPKS